MAEPEHDAEAALQAWWAEGLDEDAAWDGLRTGPSVAEVAERLSSIPRPFLAHDVDLLALAGDVWPDLVPADGDVVALLRRITALEDPGVTAGAAALLWLSASVEVVGPFSAAWRGQRRPAALAAAALRLGRVVPSARWLSEAERREEAARVLLLWTGHLPAGEDAATARALFEMVDTVRRDAALARAHADHAHRQQVLRALEEKRAREAAARYQPE